MEPPSQQSVPYEVLPQIDGDLSTKHGSSLSDQSVDGHSTSGLSSGFTYDNAEEVLPLPTPTAAAPPAPNEVISRVTPLPKKKGVRALETLQQLSNRAKRFLGVCSFAQSGVSVVDLVLSQWF